MAGIGLIMSVIGTGLSVVGKIQEGKAQQEALNFEAKMRESKAKEERAAGQRDMLEKRQETAMVLSRQQALAAASGAGVETPTVLDIYEETAARGRYLENIAQYGGESRARGQLDQAAAARFKGKVARQAGILGGVAEGFAGFGKAFGSPGSGSGSIMDFG